LSRRLNEDFGAIRFGATLLRLYGTEATIARLGAVSEHLVSYVPASGLRALLERAGICSPPYFARHLISIGTVPGWFSPRNHQTVVLQFPCKVEAEFNMRDLRRSGLGLTVHTRVTAIFSSVTGDLVPFGFKRGLDWIWLYGDTIDRLEFAGHCHGEFATAKFQSVAGYLHDAYEL
jgi:hypothetical protein